MSTLETVTRMKGVATRVAGAADASQVVALLLAQMRDHAIPVSREHLARRVTTALDDGEPVILVAAAGETLVGVAYVSFALPLEHEGEVAWVEELFVAPERRNAGIGAMLLRAVRAHAEARGCLAIELETKRGHERAGNLYRRQGFVDLGRTHYAHPLEGWDWPPLG
jgi:GNAT superfamily N-acetyltransferase